MVRSCVPPPRSPIHRVKYLDLNLHLSRYIIQVLRRTLCTTRSCMALVAPAVALARFAMFWLSTTNLAWTRSPGPWQNRASDKKLAESAIHVGHTLHPCRRGEHGLSLCDPNRIWAASANRAGGKPTRRNYFGPRPTVAIAPSSSAPLSNKFPRLLP